MRFFDSRTIAAACDQVLLCHLEREELGVGRLEAAWFRSPESFHRDAGRSTVTPAVPP